MGAGTPGPSGANADRQTEVDRDADDEASRSGVSGGQAGRRHRGVEETARPREQRGVPAPATTRLPGLRGERGRVPCMFDRTADPGHKATRFMFTMTGNVPRRV